MSEKKIGFETTEDRLRQLIRKELEPLERRLAELEVSTKAIELEPLKIRLDQLETSIEALEVRAAHVERLGEHKRTHCQFNTGGICRSWRFANKVEIPGMQVRKLAETGKFHVVPTAAYCASCSSFQSIPGIIRTK